MEEMDSFDSNANQMRSDMSLSEDVGKMMKWELSAPNNNPPIQENDNALEIIVWSNKKLI